MINLYYSFIYPYLNYCNQVWGNAYITNLKLKVLMQKHIQTPDWTYVNKPFATLVPHYGTPFPSTLRRLRPSNYLNETWNHIYYLLGCSHFKLPCSTSFKLNNCIDIITAEQKKKKKKSSSYASYGGNIIFLCTTNPFCCHWFTYVQEEEFFTQQVVNKPHTVSTSLCQMYMILLLPCCLWCLYFKQ